MKSFNIVITSPAEQDLKGIVFKENLTVTIVRILYSRRDWLNLL
jgi:hypothetical protein